MGFKSEFSTLLDSYDDTKMKELVTNALNITQPNPKALLRVPLAL